MITRKQASTLSEIFDLLHALYDDHVLEKVSIEIEPGNNVVIKWDDMSEDDVEGLKP